MKLIVPVLYLGLVLLPAACLSQTKTVDVDKNNLKAIDLFYSVNGTPFVEAKFVRLVSGTPYFKTEWQDGLLISDNDGTRYKGQLKLDLYSNEVHYLDSKDNEFLVTVPVKQLILYAPDTSYSFVHAPFVQEGKASSKDYWYLQLYSDSVSLYKYFQKFLSEDRPYNSATYEQTIKTTDVYWVSYRGTPIEIKKLKDAPSLFGDKKDALNAFIKTSDDKQLSMDGRMIAFVKYLNSLVKK